MRALLTLLFALPLFAAAEVPQPPADLTAPPADAERHESGLVTRKLSDGAAALERLSDDDIARVRYTVWKSDGTLVQHIAAPRSLTITLPKMLPGWAEAVRLMSVGETRRAWIPPSLGAGKIKEGETLVIDTELLRIVRRPDVPADVAAPPADARVTESGLAYKILKAGAGAGASKPKRGSKVLVHYSGWTTDGRMFDSSVIRDEPMEFSLRDVIRGWTEGLQLMTEGEIARFWIPAKLAYANDKTKPQGTLVFDIELIEVR